MTGPYQNLLELFYDIGMRSLPILEMWRRKGMNVDVRRALFYEKLLQAKLAKGEELIAKLVGPYFNWRSPQQKAELFYKKWGLPPQYNERERGVKTVTTDDRARQRLQRWIERDPVRAARHKPALQFFTLLGYTSETKKLVEYFERISPDHKIHAYWKPYDVTFRLSSVPNVQNWPTWSIGKDSSGEPLGSLRSIVIPDHEDDYFIMFDFDQIELWTYAKIFNIKYLLDIYDSGEYVYGRAYEDAFKKPFFIPGRPRTKKYRHPDVTDEELLRAKAIPLGFLYGRAGESVAAEHGWPAEEGIRYRRDWYAKNPELPAAHSWITYQMNQKGRLRPPPGFLLNYPQPDLQGLNCFGQTPAFAMLMSSLIAIEDEFARRGWKNTRTVLCVHDSGLVNVGGGRTHPERVRECYEEVINPILTRPVPWLDGFRYRHEAKFGGRWDWDALSYEKWKETVYAGTTSNVTTI